MPTGVALPAAFPGISNYVLRLLPHCLVRQLQHWTALILDTESFLECHLVSLTRTVLHSATDWPETAARTNKANPRLLHKAPVLIASA